MNFCLQEEIIWLFKNNFDILFILAIIFLAI